MLFLIRLTTESHSILETSLDLNRLCLQDLSRDRILAGPSTFAFNANHLDVTFRRAGQRSIMALDQKVIFLTTH